MTPEPTVRDVLAACYAGFQRDPNGYLASSVVPSGLLHVWVLGSMVGLLFWTLFTMAMASWLQDELVYGVVFYSGLVAFAGLSIPVLLGTALGLLRALWAREREGTPLGWWSALRDLGRGAIRVSGLWLGMLGLTGVAGIASIAAIYGLAPGAPGVFSTGPGALGLIAASLVCFTLAASALLAPFFMASPLVALLDWPILRALRFSFAFFLARPGFSIGLSVAVMSVLVLVQVLPLVGPGLSCLVWTQAQVHAYAMFFGLGDEPEVQHASLVGARGLG